MTKKNLHKNDWRIIQLLKEKSLYESMIKNQSLYKIESDFVNFKLKLSWEFVFKAKNKSKVLLEWKSKWDWSNRFRSVSWYFWYFIDYYFWFVNWDKFWRNVFWKIEESDLIELYAIAQTKDEAGLNQIISCLHWEWKENFISMKISNTKKLREINNEISELQKSRRQEIWKELDLKDIETWIAKNSKYSDKSDSATTSERSKTSDNSISSEFSKTSELSKKSEESEHSRSSDFATISERSKMSDSSESAKKADFASSVDEWYLIDVFKKLPSLIEAKEKKEKLDSFYSEDDRKKILDDKEDMQDFIWDLTIKEHEDKEEWLDISFDSIEEENENKDLLEWAKEDWFVWHVEIDMSQIDEDLKKINENDDEEEKVTVIRVWHVMIILIVLWILWYAIYYFVR